MRKHTVLAGALTVAALAIGVVVFQSGWTTNAQSKESGNPKTNSRTVVYFGTDDVVPNAGTTLNRDPEGVFFTFHTGGLTAGNVVTAWIVIFNNPRYCATSPCSPADIANPLVDALLANSGGRVIGLDGAATFGAYRSVGDITGRQAGSMNGLVNPLRAEIHVVLRDHGEASMDPGTLHEQLTTFNGGCPGGVGCMNVQASINVR